MMLKVKNKDYDWAVNSIRLNTSFLGLWNDSINSIFSTLPIIFISSYLFCFSIIPQTWALYRMRKHFDLVIGNIVVLISFFIAIYKLLFLLKKKKVLKNLFLIIREDWNFTMSKSEREILVRYWKLSHKIHIYALLLSLGLPLVYHSTLFFHFVVRAVTNLTDVIGGRYFVQSSYYPFDTQPSPIYEIMIINELCNGIVCCLGIAISDVLYSIFVLHACGQLEILAGRMRSFTDNDTKNYSLILRSHVRHHLRIIGFAENIDELFNGTLLIVFSHFTVVFCLQGFTLIKLTSNYDDRIEGIMRTMFFITYGVYMLFLNYLYCWAGENLMTRSGEIHHAVYSCNWMDLPLKISIELNLIQLRSDKPLAITAGKILPVTLNTYAKILKTCGGFISMLLALDR